MSKTSTAMKTSLATMAAVVALAGCETPMTMNERQRTTATGAGIGAASGAVIGAMAGDRKTAAAGAVVGGALGAVAGNLWSKRLEEKRAEMQRATQGTGIDVARTSDNQLKVNVPSDFSFDSGSAEIKPQMRPVLDQLAQGLDPSMRLTIVGHTDNVGGDQLNNRLSLERASNVRDYLRRQGVEQTRMIVNGRGEDQPIANNDTAAGRAQNRRVEIFVSDPASRG